VSSERDFFSEWSEPVWSLYTSLTGILDWSALTVPTTSFFQIPIKGTTTPLLWVAGS
jgi:hypothetical protein